MARSKSNGSANRHKHISPQRGSSMAESHAHKSLVVVVTMRVPEFFAADEALEERHRRIYNERREYEQGKPWFPGACLPTRNSYSPAQESKRNGAGISHENPGRREIEQQKRQRG